MFIGLYGLIISMGRYTILPLLLLFYKNWLLLKIKLKTFNFFKIQYLGFLKKYLPASIIIIIIIINTTHNIVAQRLSADEYVNRTLLPLVITSNDQSWSEITVDSAPAQIKAGQNTYLDESANLQELTINTPFPADTDYGYGDVTPDSSGVVINGPEGMNDEQPSQATRTETIEYIVQSGDVLGKIAEKFNLSINTILWANKLTWNSTIKPGQKLIILPGSGVNHEVVSGDTIASIAKKYQADSQAIVKANNLASSGAIKKGDLLFIPNGIKPTQVVSSYKPKPKASAPAQTANVNIDDLPAASDSGAKFQWPLISTRITQYFSWRHTGVDVGDKVGQPIYAAESGKVERSGWNSGYGYNVIINHGNGVETLYGHSSKLLVEDGDTVERGQIIALIGSTGWSTGPHLHFEVRVGGVRQNPLNYIK